MQKYKRLPVGMVSLYQLQVPDVLIHIGYIHLFQAVSRYVAIIHIDILQYNVLQRMLCIIPFDDGRGIAF